MAKLAPHHEKVNAYAGELSVETIKASSDGPVPQIAGAIAGQVRDNGIPDVHAIGADAVTRAIKAVVVAREYLAEDGIDAIVIPFLNAATIGGEERTVLRLMVESR